jgi:hypothetical protein
MTTSELAALEALIREAWEPIPAPPREDLQFVDWWCGKDVYEAFAGVPPLEVDLGKLHFAEIFGAIPPSAAAAYIGTYALLFVQDVGQMRQCSEKLLSHLILHHYLIHGHLTVYLRSAPFWERVGPYLPPKCREVMVKVVALIASEARTFGLKREEVETMIACAASCAQAQWRQPAEKKKVERKKGWQR